MPIGQTDPRDFGDMPRNWASHETIRLVPASLVLERATVTCWKDCLPHGSGRERRPEFEACSLIRPDLLEFRVTAIAAALLRVDPRRKSPSRLVLHLGKWARSDRRAEHNRTIRIRPERSDVHLQPTALPVLGAKRRDPADPVNLSF